MNKSDDNIKLGIYFQVSELGAFYIDGCTGLKVKCDLTKKGTTSQKQVMEEAEEELKNKVEAYNDARIKNYVLTEEDRIVWEKCHHIKFKELKRRLGDKFNYKGNLD